MELAHDDVFQATADELFPGAEYLRADEPRYVVEVHPWRGLKAGPALGLAHLPLEKAREAVLARLVDDHVGSLAVAVGEIGALPRLEIEAVLSVPAGGIIQHLLQREIERGVGRGATRQTLKPDPRCPGMPTFQFRLNV